MDWIGTLNNWKYESFSIPEILDAIIFLLFLIAVLYLLVFSLASLKKQDERYIPANKNHHFVILYPAYKADNCIINSVLSFLKQNYPMEFYEIVIISSFLLPETLEKLKKLPVRIIEANFPDCTKTSIIQYATKQIANESYDMLVVLDANNTVVPNFLEQINNAYYSGCDAIQTHRISQSPKNPMEALIAVAEEINNSIFRKGHVRLGFSSALISSGMAIDFEWFKNHYEQLNKFEFDKSLESLLFKDYIYIEYLEDVYTVDEKVSKSHEFQQQRRKWMSNQSANKASNLWALTKAILDGNWDYSDKLLQWLMPSRMFLLGLLFLYTLGIFIVDWPLAIKWIGLCLLALIALAISVPDKCMTKQFQRALLYAPFLFLLLLPGISKITGKNK